jgi:hypothetical protein
MSKSKLAVVGFVAILIGFGAWLAVAKAAPDEGQHDGSSDEHHNVTGSFCGGLFRGAPEEPWTETQGASSAYDLNGVTVTPTCEISRTEGEVSVSVVQEGPEGAADAYQAFLDKPANEQWPKALDKNVSIADDSTMVRLVVNAFEGFSEPGAENVEGMAAIPRSDDYLVLSFTYSQSEQPEFAALVEELISSLTVAES